MPTIDLRSVCLDDHAAAIIQTDAVDASDTCGEELVVGYPRAEPSLAEVINQCSDAPRIDGAEDVTFKTRLSIRLGKRECDDPAKVGHDASSAQLPTRRSNNHP